MIHSYRAWRGVNTGVKNLHPSLVSKTGGDDVLLPFAPIGRWQLIRSDQEIANKRVSAIDKTKKSSAETPAKRKNPAPVSVRPSKKRKLPPPAPVGLMWDRVNYSCAYDTLFVRLYHIWNGHGPLWTNRFASVTEYTDQLGKGFESYALKTRTSETVRDQVRRSLATANPTGFPNGPEFTFLYMLTDTMFGSCFWGRETLKCLKCNLVDNVTQGYPCTRTVYKDVGLKATYKDEYMLSHWLNALKISRTFGRCTVCKGGLARIEVPVIAPPVLHFALDDSSIRLDPSFNITVWQATVRYALRSVIYIGNHHFTTRILKENGDVWFHDGIETGLTCIAEGQALLGI
ncbi:hypothetical protein DFH08DRAFT_714817 [Mycena albidolilacea]|uniref:Uncharacterized protein n=1 Tax=Mycena albidolilacea TaxID=1033008 RepID=A0AAD6ZDY6_9AGAR|nr:hypothetical protein DFH08DRAFT_714817 [Mycena albidolilacea]